MSVVTDLFINDYADMHSKNLDMARFKIGEQVLYNPLHTKFPEMRGNLLGHLQNAGSNKVEFGLEVGQDFHQGMDGPSVFQVPGEADLHVLQGLQFLVNCVDIEQRLRRMLASPVTGIEHGDLCGICRFLGRSDTGMADDDHISVLVHGSGGIGNGLTLGCR